MNSFLKLADCCEKIGSGSTPRGGHKSYVAKGIPLIRSQNVLMRSFTREGLAFITSTTHEEMAGTEVFRGDVLLNITGASIGRVCLVPDEICPANVNQHVCIIRCGKRIDPQFLMLYLSSPAFQKLIDDTQAGGTRQALTKSDIEAFEIPDMDINKQREIARKLAVKLKSIATAAAASNIQLNEAVLLARKVRTDISESATGIEQAYLDDLLLNIETGKSIQTTEQAARDDQLGVLKVSAVSWGEFRAREAKAVFAGYRPEDHHRVRKGDVLITRANTVELVGAVVRVDRDYPNRLLSDKTLRLLLDEKRCDPDYIVQVLKLPEARQHIEGNATGTSNSMRNISQDTIRATPIPLPKLPEQRRIAARLRHLGREMWTLSSAIQKQTAEIKLLPRKLLAQAFEI